MVSRGLLVLVLLVGASLAGAAAAGQSTVDRSAPPAPGPLVTPDGEPGYVWPYTSRTPSVAGRTLALNVVVDAGPERVRRLFVDRSDANWSRVEGATRAGVSPWRPAHGSVRYTYVTPTRTAAGRWIPATYQLAVGPYFGRRAHVRAYPGPTGDWTALQAHTEYWDWYRVRHTVTGVDAGARFVERDVRDESSVATVSRTRHGHEGGGSDGWWTVVGLVPAAVLARTAGRPGARRVAHRELLLVGALAALPLGLRLWALGAEATAPGVDPKLFVAVGYPVLAVGPPALVSVLARDSPAARAALLGATGLGAGIVLDAALVGTGPPPGHLLGHRAGLAAALGVLAFGAARSDGRLVGVGLAGWSVGLAAPLLGVP